MLAKAGPEAIKKLSERFMPDPTTLERVTAFAILPKSDGGPPRPIPSIIFHMSKPFDKAKLEKTFAPQGARARAGDKSFTMDQQNDMAVYVIDDRTFQISPAHVMEKLLTNRPSAQGPLAPVLSQAASRPVTLAFSAAALPAELRAQIPAPRCPSPNSIWRRSQSSSPRIRKSICGSCIRTPSRPEMRSRCCTRWSKWVGRASWRPAGNSSGCSKAPAGRAQ